MPDAIRWLLGAVVAIAAALSVLALITGVRQILRTRLAARPAPVDPVFEAMVQRLAEMTAQRDYFRARYERLADSVLFKHQEIAAPVHVERPVRQPEDVERRSPFAGLAIDEIDSTRAEGVPVLS